MMFPLVAGCLVALFSPTLHQMADHYDYTNHQRMTEHFNYTIHQKLTDHHNYTNHPMRTDYYNVPTNQKLTDHYHNYQSPSPTSYHSTSTNGSYTPESVGSKQDTQQPHLRWNIRTHLTSWYHPTLLCLALPYLHADPEIKHFWICPRDKIDRLRERRH